MLAVSKPQATAKYYPYDTSNLDDFGIGCLNRYYTRDIAPMIAMKDGNFELHHARPVVHQLASVANCLCREYKSQASMKSLKAISVRNGDMQHVWISSSTIQRERAEMFVLRCQADCGGASHMSANDGPGSGE